MLAGVKIRLAWALGVAAFLAPGVAARAADAPLPKPLLPSQAGSAARPLSRLEIFQAIQDHLAKLGVPRRAALRPADLRIQSALPPFQGDSGLAVKRVGYDPIRRELVFDLWAANEPAYLPFAVTTRRDPQSLGLNLPAGVSSAPTEISNPASPLRPHLPILVKPGRPATLVMVGQDIRITTTVAPLQPGSLGQSILVRDLDTARVISAEVAGEGLLHTSF